MDRTRLRVFLTSLLPLFVAAHFSHHVITAITTPALPLIRDSFGLSYTSAGLMLSAYVLAYGGGHLVVGWLMGKVSPRVLITMGISGVAFFGLLIGFSGSFAMLVAFQFCLGLAGSGYHPAATTLISASVEPQNRGSALGLHIIGGSASYFITPLLVGLLIGPWGWRGAFLALAVPVLILGMILFSLLGRVVPGARGRSEKESDHVPESAASWPVITAVLVLATIGGAIVQSTIAFVPLMTVDVHGVSEQTAAGLMALIFSAGLWVSPLAGWLSDRLGRLPLLVAASLIVIPAIAMLARVPYGVPFWALLVLIGVYIFVRMPTTESFILGHVAPVHRSRVLGLYFFGSSAGGAVFTPLVGRIADGYGFGTGFAVLSGILLALTVVCGILIFISVRRSGSDNPTAGASRDSAPTTGGKSEGHPRAQ